MKKVKSNPDPGPLRVLILEDNPADAELIERELRRAGIVFSSRLVEGKREYSKALAEFQPQVILSDFKLPRFAGLAALEITRLRAPDIPFIFVSGSIGEDKAIEMLAQGASDYILKENLARLGPAIKRVVEETCLKLEKKKSDEELRRHVDELRLLAEAADHFVQINDLDKLYNYLTQMVRDLSGADYLLLTLYDEKLQAVRPKIVTGFEPFRETLRRRFHIDPMQMVFYLKDMRQDDFSDFVSRRLVPVRDGLYGLANRKMPRSICRLIEKLMAIGSMYTMGFSWENQLFGGLTVFFKKEIKLKNASQIEALINQAAVSIKRLLAEQALSESEKKYRTLVTHSPDGIFIADLQGNFLSVNQAMCDGLNYSEAEFLSLKISDIVPEQYLDLHKQRLAAILKGEVKNEATEYVVKGKDGESHYTAILSTPYYKDNQIIGFQGIARDITEKKKMEIRLRESEEYYRTLVETSPDAIIIVDAGGRVTFASRKTLELFGIFAQTSIKGFSILDFVEPGEVPRVQERMVEILSGHSLPQVKEYRLQRQDRRPFWAEVSSAPLQDAAGRNIGLLLICRDISERKRAETIQQIQYKIANAVVTAKTFFSFFETVRKELSALLDTTNFLIALYDEASGMLSAPFEKDEKDVIPQWPADKSLTGLVLKQKRSILLHREEIRQLFQVGTIELIGSRAEAWLGVPLQINDKVLGAIVLQSYDKADAYDQGSVSIMEMIANQVSVYIERKRAKAELLREKAFLEKLVESAPEGIAIHDNLGQVLRVNSEFVRMFGYEVNEAVGKKIDDLIVPPEYLEEAGTITKSVGAGKLNALETVRKRKDGTLLNVSIIGAPIHIAEQQVAIYAIYRDISERKQAEEELRISAEKWQSTFNSITDIVSVISLDHTFLEINKAGCDAMGLKRKDIIGKKCYELVHNLHNPLTGCPCSQTIQSKKMEMNEVFENGRYFQLTAWPILDANGELLAFSHTVKDISERKRAEEQIRASLKEKEVLLQEIHHRVKNNLQIISGLLTLQAEQSTGKSLDEIFKESQDRIRSIALIHEKLYRSHNLAEIAFDEYLRALIENLLISHGVAAGRVTVSYKMESILFTIEKAIPLGLIVNELVTNSLKHAFPAGQQGEIRIGLHGYKGAKSYAVKTDSGTLRCVQTCELIVADNGIGLPAGQIPEQQKSLGMNLVSMLAKQLQAELKITTGPGTEFRLLFPGVPANQAVKDNGHGD